MSRPSLSLAIIAKNEEENLHNCLQSVHKHVDELVVVDTGSTDGTRAVATQFGANVFDFSSTQYPGAFLLDNEETCREFGYDIPGSYSNELHGADFAAARNVSFDNCHGDYILWVDADDVVEGAEHLREIVDDLHSRGMDMGFLAYDYARDEQGRVFYRQWRERIVKRGIAHWVNPVHEVLLPKKQSVQPVKYDKTKMVHHRKPTRGGLPNRNYKILLRHLKTEHPKPDPRTLFYLGQEARFLEPQRAVGFYEAYLRASGWPEERAAAHAALGAIYEFGLSGLPPEEALSRANRDFAVSAVEMPDNPDGLFGLARIAYLRGRWADCVRYTEHGFKIGNTESMLGANPMDRLYRPHVYYNHALANLGRLADAAHSCREALKVCPDDPGVPGGASGMLSLNLKVYEQKLAEMSKEPPNMKKLVDLGKDEDLEAPAAELPNDVYAIWTIQLWKQCIARGDGQRARQLLESIPPSISIDPVFARMREITDRKHPATQQPPTKFEIKVNAPAGADAEAIAKAVAKQLAVVTGGGGKPSTKQRRIVIWVGPAFEPWDPTTPNTKGIGGSETAVIEMGRELTKLGCKVVVYGDCEATAGIYDGVEYRHYTTFTGEDCDVFISSRVPSVMQFADRIKAKLKLLWVHDIHCGEQTADMSRWLLCFDRILCLSNWHRDFFLSCYSSVAPETVLVTRNGISTARFASEPVKHGNRLIYSSSPNRGLDALIQMFPLIRAQVPDAELHVFYGFDVWEKFARMRNNEAELADIQRYKDLLAKAQTQGGVVWHGRAPQDKLAEHFLGAKVWAYPTTFPETSCCHPDTLISVPGDHRGGPPRVRIADLVGKANFPVYAYDADQHRFRIATATKVWETKIADEMVDVELDDGTHLRLTPDHLVMNFDEEWVQAGDLTPGTRLMALHHRYNVMIKDADGSWTDEHRLVGEWKTGRKLLSSEHVDHADSMRLDNSPDSLTVLTASDHFRKTHKGTQRTKRSQVNRIANWQQWAASHPEELRARLGRNGKKLWDWVRSLPPEARKAWQAERARKRVETMRIREASEPEYAARLLAQRQENGRKGCEKRWNHMVVSVKRIPGGPVYDMEVAELHNFVADGVVVHNCITAMEAQAAGCVPVTSKYAALAETVKHGIVIPFGPDYGRQWVDSVIRVLKDDALRTALATNGRAYALENLSWASLARDWLQMFDRLTEEVRVNPVPAWRAF